jgi:hypothetical protein
MVGKSDAKEWGTVKPVNYLVTNYIDLKEVIDAVENMIAGSPCKESSSTIRELCRVSVKPLQASKGHILQILIPEKILQDE